MCQEPEISCRRGIRENQAQLLAGTAVKAPYKQKHSISETTEAQKQSKKKSDATTTSPFSFCFIFRSFFRKITKVYIFVL